MKILAIETSCDDTGIAILESNLNSQPKLLAGLVSSQTKIHAPWGGVVPMLAKREHQKNLVLLLGKALKKSRLLKKHKLQNTNYKQNTDNKIQEIKLVLERESELLKNLLPFLKKYAKPDIDYIAVTIGPGLEPALWAGVNFARALSFYWNIPLIPINHIEGHLTAAFAFQGKSSGIFNFQFSIFNKNNFFPAIALVVSGGHTQLILIRKFGKYQIIGETRDDAAGEAFDKVAKMLNLPYPGGPAIAATAAKLKISAQDGSASGGKNYKLKTNSSLPRPMIKSGDFDFSFSGLKTAVLYTLQKMTKAQIKKLTPALAAEFQQAIVDVLTTKTLAAAKKFKAQTVMLSGGVAANDLLRKTLKLKTINHKLNFLVPPKKFCTDNAVMIALAAWLKIKKRLVPSRKTNWQNLKTEANLRIF
jgi:N6-L-threonylcarbamoyladenine synthase